jgi:prepilin-type N-terminal cleavage/methylation domain-containing protein
MAAMTPAVIPTPTSVQSGFTLVELAMVLFIVALLIGGILLPLSAQQDVRARYGTEKALDDVRDSLIGFAIANGRLPCPATAASNGISQPAGGGACTCVSPDCFVPAATLGIAPVNSVGQAVDGWQFPIRYAVTGANANAFTTTDGLRAIWGSPTLAPDLTVCPSSACAATLTSTAAAVIWSTGKNSTEGGTSADEQENPNPKTGAGNVDPTANRFVSRSNGSDFDDIVIWISPNTLYNRMVAAGRLP